MRRVVRLLHDIYMLHIEWNSVRSCPKLLVVKWLGLSVTVRVKVRAGAGILISVLLLLFLFQKVLNTFVFPSCPSLSLVVM